MKFNSVLSLVETKDGSHTILHSIGDHYHSRHGAIEEAKHVYINAGLQYVDQDTITLLEVGFGTGLNVFLTLLYKGGKKVRYITLEPDALSVDVVEGLNYPALLNEDRFLFDYIHSSSWNAWVEIEKGFDLLKMKEKLENVILRECVDLIYYDAFAPRYQPELWTVSIFKKCFSLLSVNGVLVTYCAKGSVKRALKEAGFFVETCQGPPGKREMVRAKKTKRDEGNCNE